VIAVDFVLRVWIWAWEGWEGGEGKVGGGCRVLSARRGRGDTRGQVRDAGALVIVACGGHLNRLVSA